MIRPVLFVAALLFLVPSTIFASETSEFNYIKYPFKSEVLDRHQEVWLEYLAIYQVANQEGRQLTLDERSRVIQLTKVIHEAEPQWLDGYWLYASELFQRGSIIVNKRDLPIARKFFVQSRELSRACVLIEKNNPICKFLLGSAIGKIATIDGVFASLRHGREVYGLWMDVINSPYNHMLTDKISMQGTVRYALGIFLRLVPDWAILQWFFGVKGDLDESISALKESMVIDGPFACGRLMLAASLICKAGGNEDQESYKEGMGLLQKIPMMEVHSVQTEICKQDSLKLRQDSDLACGYSTARQQEETGRDQL